MRWVDSLARDLGFDRLVFRHELCDSIAALNPMQEEPGPEFVRRTKTTILGETYSVDEKGDPEFDEEPMATELGYVYAWHLLGGYALDAGVDIVEEAEAVSGDAHDAAVILFGEDGNGGLIWNDETSDMLGGFKHNALYIHEIFVTPVCRGRNLGAVALRRVIEHHDPAGLATIILYPNAQHLMDLRDPYAKMPERDAQKKLVSYYRRLGFRSYKRTGFLYLNVEHYDYQWREKGADAPLLRRVAVRRAA